MMKLPSDILTETLAFTTVELMNFKERAAQFEAMVNEQRGRADSLAESLAKAVTAKNNIEAVNDELRAELELLRGQLPFQDTLHVEQLTVSEIKSNSLSCDDRL